MTEHDLGPVAEPQALESLPVRPPVRQRQGHPPEGNGALGRLPDICRDAAHQLAARVPPPPGGKGAR